MTYGQLRLAVQKENLGTDLELLDSYIQDAYTEILDLVPWKRQEAESTFQAPPSYAVGTITATQGSAAITGVGTTWTTAMTGLMIRVDNQSEYYQFTYVSATSGTLDRPFEQPSASGLAYRIDQSVFLLSSDCRILRGIKPLHNFGRPLERMTPSELDAFAPQRLRYGTPTIYAPTWDSFSDPPQMQVELYPIPDSPDSAGATLSWVADYVFDAADIDATQTGASLLPWVRPAALKAAVKAKVLALGKDYTGAAYWNDKAAELVQVMLRNNAMQRGPQEIRMAPEYRRRNIGIKPPNVRWQDR